MMKTIRDIEIKTNFSILVLILSVSAVLTYEYFSQVDKPYFEPRLELHNQIIAGTAPSPYRYRILVPFAVEVFTKTLSADLPIKTRFLLSYALYDLLAVFFLLAALFHWLRIWFNSEQALVGVLFVAGTMPITFQDQYFQPWSLLEAGLFTTALLVIYRKNYWLLAFLVALASLNRETAIFIPLTFLLTIETKNPSNIKSRDVRNRIFLFSGLLLIWATIFGGLRYFRGSAPQVETISGLLIQNTTAENLFNTFVNGSLFLGGLWVFALLGFRHAPLFIKQVATMVPIYLMIIIVWGVWHEVRLLMTLYPILVPLGLSFLYPQQQKTMSA